MASPLNLSGKRFGRLLVIERGQNSKIGSARWKCVCDCGNNTLVVSSKLSRGVTYSCGCANMDKTIKTCTTHGLTKSSEYSIWREMKARCLNPNNHAYHNYGGRGITVCDRWKESFENFISDMGPRPSKKHSIERENVNGNYEPSNCKWATRAEQSRNMRRNKWIDYDGRKMLITDVAKELKIPSNLFFHHIKRKSIPEIIEFYKNKQ